MKSYARALLLMLASVITVLADPSLVTSTNHGGGWFSYTFQRGDTPYVWGIQNDGSNIQLPSRCVLEVRDAPGWTHSVSPSGLITWAVTNGIVFLDEPVTFSVRSCLSHSGILNGGYILGGVYELPGRTNRLAGGYQRFDFIGPASPALNIERNGVDVTIWWSVELQGLNLEATEQLDAAASWVLVTNLPTVVNSNFVLSLPAADSQKFFRLAAP